MKKWYSIKEVAEYLGIKYMTARRYIRYCDVCWQRPENCTCKVFKPRLKSIDLNKGHGQRIFSRVSIQELRKYEQNHQRRKNVS